jgi:hypothetical protein
MAHESNLAKSVDESDGTSANCPLCAISATQAHINTVCSHPALQDQRIFFKRNKDLHFLCLRHTVLPPAERWISILMHYAETHLWEESERRGTYGTGDGPSNFYKALENSILEVQVFFFSYIIDMAMKYSKYRAIHSS